MARMLQDEELSKQVASQASIAERDPYSSYGPGDPYSDPYSSYSGPIHSGPTPGSLRPTLNRGLGLSKTLSGRSRNHAEAGSLDSPSKYESNHPTYGSSQREVNGKLENRIVLSSREIIQMAEHEIGKDNVKIMAGFSVTKYGREGRPHQRKMWVNSSLTHLAWVSNQYDGSHRGLDLAQVTDIRAGKFTATISRSTKNRKKVQNLCFSLITPERTLDLQACSIIQRDTLIAALKKVVEFNHKHKPVRKGKHRTEVSVFTD